MNGNTDRPRASRSLAGALLGRSFVHPLVDYLVIGGGLSLLVTVALLLYPELDAMNHAAALPFVILLTNSAHFASSTVRLYTKPGARQALPFLTMAFPLVVFALLTGCLFLASRIGPHVLALYLTWSPYHYAAQAYGLALVYAYRAGCRLLPQDKRLLWWASLVPFLHTFCGAPTSGLHWLLPADVLALPLVGRIDSFLFSAWPWVGYGAAIFVLVKVARSSSGPLPLISVLLLVSNATWWFVLPQSAFVWATIFHGLQYLGIVTIFHVQDQRARPDNRQGILYHLAWFYGASLLLGYGLFSCLPLGFVAAGFGMVESIVLVVAAINIHHFVVDAYIWRLGKGDRNREIVESELAAV